MDSACFEQWRRYDWRSCNYKYIQRSFLSLYLATNSTNDRRRVKLVDSRESAISPNLSGRIVAWRMDAVNYSARASYKCMKRRERFPTRGLARLNFTFQSSALVRIEGRKLSIPVCRLRNPRLFSRVSLLCNSLLKPNCTTSMVASRCRDSDTRLRVPAQVAFGWIDFRIA